jgi:hypothetical protein
MALVHCVENVPNSPYVRNPCTKRPKVIARSAQKGTAWTRWIYPYLNYRVLKQQDVPCSTIWDIYEIGNSMGLSYWMPTRAAINGRQLIVRRPARTCGGRGSITPFSRGLGEGIQVWPLVGVRGRCRLGGSRRRLRARDRFPGSNVAPFRIGTPGCSANPAEPDALGPLQRANHRCPACPMRFATLGGHAHGGSPGGGARAPRTWRWRCGPGERCDRRSGW